MNAHSHWFGRLWWRLSYAQPIQATLSKWGRHDEYLAWFNTVQSPITRLVGASGYFCERAASMIGPQAFVFFGVERVLSDNRGWHWKPWGEEWLHNLHAFDDLISDNAIARYDWHQKMITNWMVANPPGKGIGWRAPSSSRRIVNWVKWDLAKSGLTEVSRRNLIVQVRFFRQHLGKALNTPYLTKPGIALLFAGAFFEGTEADGWRRTGLSLMRYLAKTVLDGKLSLRTLPVIPMAEDFLDLVQLARIYPGLFGSVDTTRWQEAAARLLEHASDEPPGAPVESPVFFSEPSADVVRQYGQRLGLKIL